LLTYSYILSTAMSVEDSYGKLPARKQCSAFGHD
jgi:hypothetical protein